MRLLLDTHAFLWFISGNTRLSQASRNGILDPSSTVYLSIVAVWESIIKYQLGRLPLPEPPEIYLPRERRQQGILSLGIDDGTLLHLPKIPSLHRDPFDRIMVCQALQHDLIIVTADVAIQDYPVRTLN